MDALYNKINREPIEYKGWKSELERSGAICFSNQNKDYWVYASPDWELTDEEVVEEGHLIYIQAMHEEDVIDELNIRFDGTYGDYKEKIIEYLEEKHTQLTPLERAKGLVNINNIRALRMSLKSLYGDLEDEGFEHAESIELLTTMIKGYLEDIDIPYGVLEEMDDIV